MKVSWLIFRRLLLAVVGFLVLYVLLAVLLSYIPTRKKRGKAPRNKTLFVHSNGVHVDFVLPVSELPEALLQQLTFRDNARYLAFGWGDKGFYLDTPTWAELKPSTALKAMFLPSPTAMHVTEYTIRGADWYQAALTQVQWEDLIRYVRSGFATDGEGRITEIIGQGYTAQDRFYEGAGSYHCFMTCNTWINAGLRDVGVRTAVWTPWDKGILRYLEPPRVTPAIPALG